MFLGLLIQFSACFWGLFCKNAGVLLGSVLIINYFYRLKLLKSSLNLSSSQGNSNRFSLTQLFGKEHPGRVRGFGLGVTQTQIFGRRTSNVGSSSSSQNDQSAREAELRGRISNMEDIVQRLLSILPEEAAAAVLNPRVISIS